MSIIHKILQPKLRYSLQIDGEILNHIAQVESNQISTWYFFLLFLSFLMNYSTLDTMSIQFGDNRITLKNILEKALKTCYLLLTKKFIIDLQTNIRIKAAHDQKCMGIVDVIVSRILIQRENVNTKNIYIEQRKAYFLKSQISTNQEKVFIRIHSGVADSTNDFIILNVKFVILKNRLPNIQRSSVEEYLQPKEILELLNQIRFLVGREEEATE
jgi:hypothetical protein